MRAWPLVMWLSLSTPAWSWADDDAWREARAALNAGRPAEAERALVGADGEAAALLRAEAMRRLGRSDEAAELLRGLATGSAAAQLRLAEVRVEQGRLADARRLIAGLDGRDLPAALAVERLGVLPGDVPPAEAIAALPAGEARARLAVRRARRLADAGADAAEALAFADRELAGLDLPDARAEWALAAARTRLDAGDVAGAMAALGSVPVEEPVRAVQWRLLAAEAEPGAGHAEQAWNSLPPGVPEGLRSAVLVVGGDAAARSGEGTERWRARIEEHGGDDAVAATHAWLLCARGRADEARRVLPAAGPERGRGLLALALALDGRPGLAAADEAEGLVEPRFVQPLRDRKLDLLLELEAWDDAEAWAAGLGDEGRRARATEERWRARVNAAATTLMGSEDAEAALALLAEAPDDLPAALAASLAKVRGEAHLQRGERRRAAGELEAAQGDLRAAEADLRSEAPGRAARASYGQARIRLAVEDPDGAVAAAERAAAQAEAGDDPTQAGHAWAFVGLARLESDPAVARAALERAADAFDRGRASLAARADVTYKLALLDFADGDPAGAKKRAKAARAQARKAGATELVAAVDALLQRLEAR